MSSASRSVRRLRMRGASEAAVRRTVHVLEDALRTASLPDSGSRMLLVRQLALGRIDAGAQPTSVALTLERAVSRIGDQWRHGDDRAAGSGIAVWFRDPLEAHLALSRRLLRGPPPTEWFWKLAVPSWNRQASRGDAMRAIVLSLAELPEAPAALRRWVSDAVVAGYADVLVGALAPGDVELLARVAGVPAVVVTRDGGRNAISPSGGDSGGGGTSRAPVPAAGALVRGERSAHRLIRALSSESACGANPARAPAGAADRRRPLHPSSSATEAPPPLETGVGPGVARMRDREIGAEILAPGGEGIRDQAPSMLPGESGFADGGGTGAAERSEQLAGRSPGAPPRDVKGTTARGLNDLAETTAAGGLLFLLPVLARLGYGEWLTESPEWSQFAVARRVLMRFLHRLAVPEGDPIWAAVGEGETPRRPPRRFVAPARWREGLLAGRGALHLDTSGPAGRVWDPSGRLLLGGWSGACPDTLLSDRRRAAVRGAPLRRLELETVRAWEIALRRWLRRFARLGGADLVLRTARLTASRTHLEVTFPLGAAEMRIRSAGLDLDPGWVPWFGRVVLFHYRSGGSP